MFCRQTNHIKKTAWPYSCAVFFVQRRNRDLNPGTLLQVYKLSKPASSTT